MFHERKMFVLCKICYCAFGWEECCKEYDSGKHHCWRSEEMKYCFNDQDSNSKPEGTWKLLCDNSKTDPCTKSNWQYPIVECHSVVPATGKESETCFTPLADLR